MSQEDGDVIQAFQQEHRAILALLAHAAKNCVDSRAGETIFEALYAALPSLETIYSEVALLREIHQIRRALRDLNKCNESSMKALQETVCNSLRRMYDILPEPLLLVVAEATEMLQERHPSCRALDSYILDLVEEVQLVLLRETKFLQHRGKFITLRLREVPPFAL